VCNANPQRAAVRSASRFSLRCALLIASAALGVQVVLAGSAGPDSTRQANAAGGAESLNLILSAAGYGEMLPCGHCTSKAGGLARRATLIQACQDTADHVLVADGGDFLKKGAPDPQVDKFLTDMLVRRLHYTVFGIGEIELGRGERYLRELTQGQTGVDWVSANILDRATRKPHFAPFVIRQAGRARVGFTSVLEPSLVPAGGDTSLAIGDPASTLQDVVDQMRSQCDLVVVFGHMRHIPLRTLLESVTGIDIAVSSHANRIENFPMRVGEVKQVFYGGVDGRFQNWANVVITPQQIYTYGGRTFYLLDHVPEDSTVVRELVAFFGTDSPSGGDGDEDEHEPGHGEEEGSGGPSGGSQR